VIEEGLVDDRIPSLQRLGRLGQLGDMPTFICEVSHELVDPRPERMRHRQARSPPRPARTPDSERRSALPRARS